MEIIYTQRGSKGLIELAYGTATGSGQPRLTKKLALVWVSSFMEPHYEPLVFGSGPGDALAAIGLKKGKKVGFLTKTSC